MKHIDSKYRGDEKNALEEKDDHVSDRSYIFIYYRWRNDLFDV